MIWQELLDRLWETTGPDDPEYVRLRIQVQNLLYYAGNMSGERRSDEDMRMRMGRRNVR